MAPFEKSIAYQSQTAQVFCLGHLSGGKWAATVSEMRLSFLASSLAAALLGVELSQHLIFCGERLTGERPAVVGSRRPLRLLWQP
jgi:hypothetical protein